MFLIATIVLGVILLIISIDHLVLLFRYEELKKDRNRAIERISRLKKLLKGGEDDKDLQNE